MERFYSILRYIIKVQLTALLIFSLLRVALLVLNYNQLSDCSAGLLLKSLFTGIVFDNLVTCYVLFLPLLLLLILALYNKTPKSVVIGCNIYFTILLSLLFSVSAADIPYFAYFNEHIRDSVLVWFKFPKDTLALIFQYKISYAFLPILVLVPVAFGWLIFRYGRALTRGNFKPTPARENKRVFLFSAGLILLCLVGMRGSVGRYPLRVVDSSFSSHVFINKLSVNPAFNLANCIKISLTKNNPIEGIADNKEALAYVRRALGVEENTAYRNPISRPVVPDKVPLDANVVLIFMESLSSDYLTMNPKGVSLTPFLNELIETSHYFENFYSAGIHTNNAVGATFFSYPTFFGKPALAENPLHYLCLPQTLHDNGYETIFFVTGNPNYDHMLVNSEANGISQYYSLADYPKEKSVNVFGVPDEYLFEFGFDRLNRTAEEGKPFFGAFLTVSNHPPFHMPAAYRQLGIAEDQAIVRYADDCMRDFFEKAKKEPWFDNTIFVLHGDHGKKLGKPRFEMTLSLNHVPLIIYSELFKEQSSKHSEMAMQIDIYPTIMGLLGYSYVNNTPGIDLLNSSRPYAYFVNDSKLGCIDNEFLYILDPSTQLEYLHRYRENKKNLIMEFPGIAEKMREYSVSMMTTSFDLLDLGLTGVE